MSNGLEGFLVTPPETLVLEWQVVNGAAHLPWERNTKHHTSSPNMLKKWMGNLKFNFRRFVRT